jgi:hypothetical protein
MIIKVDHRDITVRSRPHKHNAGSFKHRKCLIDITPDQSAQQQADTLIHEIFHAIWATRALPDPITEEECVHRLASGWATVMRDNPELCMVLEQALRSGKPIFEME